MRTLLQNLYVRPYGSFVSTFASFLVSPCSGYSGCWRGRRLQVQGGLQLFVGRLAPIALLGVRDLLTRTWFVPTLDSNGEEVRFRLTTCVLWIHLPVS
jgi:hypothetical protein